MCVCVNKYARGIAHGHVCVWVHVQVCGHMGVSPFARVCARGRVHESMCKYICTWACVCLWCCGFRPHYVCVAELDVICYECGTSSEVSLIQRDEGCLHGDAGGRCRQATLMTIVMWLRSVCGHVTKITLWSCDWGHVTEHTLLSCD